MASDKKVRQITAFNSGEYSDKLAGRVDIESFGKSARYMSNFMAEPTGGVKKFYGTDFIHEIEDPAEVVLVPFINSYEPMALVLMPQKVGLIKGHTYQELDVQIPNVTNLKDIRWQQINDRLVFVHPDTQPFTIDFLGNNEDGPIFVAGTITFDDIPYFPIGYTGEYTGPLKASGITGEITLSVAGDNLQIESALPIILSNTSAYIRRPEGPYIYNGQYYAKKSSNDNGKLQCTPAKFELIRTRGGDTTVVASGTVGVVTKKNVELDSSKGAKLNPDWGVSAMSGVMPLVPSVHSIYQATEFTETISRENIIAVLKAAGFNKTTIINNVLYISGDNIDVENGDIFATKLTTYPMIEDSIVGLAGDVYDMAGSAPFVGEIPDGDYVGRRIKIHMNTSNVIMPWWQGRTVATNAIVYSNGHYYMTPTGGECGNVQPSHLKGVASDGKINWLYLHSGTATASIVDASATHLTVRLNEGTYLPLLEYDERIFTTFQWSIWGKDGIHPSQIYMQNNRLGLVCNTKSYGAWNSLSCSDNYFDFSTEQYGQQLDTSAIVHLIPNNPDNKINWVLSFNQLYMGSYSGEFNIGATNKVFTPTTVSVDRVSVLGGTNVMPLKYKELNLFVGATGKEIYTIGYDYTRDDYVPKSLGYLTEHLLEQGVARMESINNRDQNVYLVHDNGNLSILNYVSDQQILGYSRVNLEGFVRDFCYTYANDVREAYVAVRRREGYLCFEAVSLVEPTYMLSTEYVDLDGPVTTYACPRFAGKAVYIKREPEQDPESNGLIVIPREKLNSIEEFVRVVWPEDGIMSFKKPVRVFTIGQEMTSELFTQPAFGRKMEGAQQQSIVVSLRLLESGTFEYGASNDFGAMFPYKNWGRQDEYGTWHKMFTGDATLNIPTGYAKNANEGIGPYANSTGIGINIRSTTPEPFNLLSVTEVYQ